MKRLILIIVGLVSVTAVSFAAVQIYSTSAARDVLEETFNDMSIVSMAPIQRLENPARFTYRIEMNIANPSRLTADVEVIDFKVSIDGKDFEVVPLNPWQATVYPEGNRDLSFYPAGRITISEPDIIGLKQKDAVPLVVYGALKVTAHKAWVTDSVTHDFELTSSVIFD